jgi:hypothetical protein
MQWCIKVGVILAIIGFAAFFYKDAGNQLPIHPDLDTVLILSGFGLVILYIVVYVLMMITGKSYKISHKNRCTRCGKKIPKGEVYCDFHKEEAQTEFVSHMSDRKQFTRE